MTTVKIYFPDFPCWKEEFELKLLMDKRKEELELKRKKLQELRKAREERKSTTQVGASATGSAALTSTASSASMLRNRPTVCAH